MCEIFLNRPPHLSLQSEEKKQLMEEISRRKLEGGSGFVMDALGIHITNSASSSPYVKREVVLPPHDSPDISHLAPVSEEEQRRLCDAETARMRKSIVSSMKLVTVISLKALSLLCPILSSL